MKKKSHAQEAHEKALRLYNYLVLLQRATENEYSDAKEANEILGAAQDLLIECKDLAEQIMHHADLMDVIQTHKQATDRLCDLATKKPYSPSITISESGICYCDIEECQIVFNTECGHFQCHLCGLNISQDSFPL